MRKILVVEPEVPVRREVRQACEQDGFEVLEAETGDEAISLIEGADRFSRSCSTDSSTGSNSLRRKELRTAATRGPALVARAM